MSSPDVEVYLSLASAFSAIRASWYVFGAQAAILHGAMRFTEDVDVTVLLGERQTRVLVDALVASGFSLRVKDSEAFIAQTRVLPVLHVATNIPVDVVLGGPGLEELFQSRARMMNIGGLWVPVAVAEDLVVMKVLAGRAKDLDDVEAVLAAQPALDLTQIRETLRVVEGALDQSDLLPLFEQCVRRAGPKLTS